MNSKTKLMPCYQPCMLMLKIPYSKLSNGTFAMICPILVTNYTRLRRFRRRLANCFLNGFVSSGLGRSCKGVGGNGGGGEGVSGRLVTRMGEPIFQHPITFKAGVISSTPFCLTVQLSLLKGNYQFV